MPYRVEVSPNNRATCKNKECKDAGIKILKGEIRFGSWVEGPDFQSWSYKHWGCVTPKQISNLVAETGGDPESVDGYEDLPEEVQDKVSRAMEQGHVDDDDWKGDTERNRDGKAGFRTPKSALKKQKKDLEAEGGEAAEEPESPSKGKGKKRSKKEADEEAAPKAKKARGKKAKKDEAGNEEGEAVEPPAKKRHGKAKAEKEADGDAEAAAPSKAKRKGKGRGKKKAAEAESEPEAEANADADSMEVQHTSIFGPPDENGAAEEVEEKPRKGRKSKKKTDTTEAGDEAPKPKGRGRKKAAAN